MNVFYMDMFVHMFNHKGSAFSTFHSRMIVPETLQNIAKGFDSC